MCVCGLLWCAGYCSGLGSSMSGCVSSSSSIARSGVVVVVSPSVIVFFFDAVFVSWGDSVGACMCSYFTAAVVVVAVVVS